MNFLMWTIIQNKNKGSGYTFYNPNPNFKYIGWNNIKGSPLIKPSLSRDITIDYIYTRRWVATEDATIKAMTVYLGELSEADNIFIAVWNNRTLIGYKEIITKPKNNWINFIDFIPTSLNSLNVTLGDVIYYGVAINQVTGITQIGVDSGGLIENNIWENIDVDIVTDTGFNNPDWQSAGLQGLACILQYSPIINSNAILTEEFYNTVLTQAYYDAILN